MGTMPTRRTGLRPGARKPPTGKTPKISKVREGTRGIRCSFAILWVERISAYFQGFIHGPPPSIHVSLMLTTLWYCCGFQPAVTWTREYKRGNFHDG